MSDITINNGPPFYGVPRDDSKPINITLGRQIKQCIDNTLGDNSLKNKSLEATAELALSGLKGRSKTENIRFDDILSYTTTVEDLKFFYDTIKYYQNKTTPLEPNKTLDDFFEACINRESSQ